MAAPIRYQSHEEDSGRWEGFPFREGDIVISARSKSGTTWVQMICALLVFQAPELPAPLPTLSPWLDWKITPLEMVLRRLQEQEHRRFIKTHTPLDGIPLDERASYIVIARDPRDMYISLYHQGNNIDRIAVRKLLGDPEPSPMEVDRAPRPDLPAALLAWIDNDASPQVSMDSIRGVLHHVTDAWQRRGERNVILVHYTDLLVDLEGEMRRVAERLEIDVPDRRLLALAQAATFEGMQARADALVPSVKGVLKDPHAFFRQGRSGAWREVMSEDEVKHYEARVAELAPPEVIAWLHR